MNLHLELLSVSLSLPLLLVSCLAQPEVTTIAEDGAWCWFADPRGLRVNGTRDRSYVGFVTSKGDIVVAQYDHGTRVVREQVLRARFEKDDHANPALLAHADGRLTVFYTRHAGKAMYARTTLVPEDIGKWGKERAFAPNTGKHGRNNYCYPNPCRLSAEDDRIYLFWRGDHWKPTMSFSNDGGETWSEGKIVLMKKGAGKGKRPYLKVDSNGRDTIHLAFTDGHPRNEPLNSIYYARYRGGGFERADGTAISPVEDLPFEPAQADRVYDGSKTKMRAWIWDVAADVDGRPVIVYARLPKQEEHHYHYARWDGKQWIDHEITLAGGWFPQTPKGKGEREPHYSGGVVLDHEEPSVVYLSRRVEGVFEIERWQTADGGATWQSEPVTRASQHDNVRPYVVRQHGDTGPEVLWMRLTGHYVHYTRYETSLQMAGRELR